MGNARPGPQQRTFFARLNNFLQNTVPVLYVHANSGVGNGTPLQYHLFNDTPNIEALQIDDGGKNAPLKITVGFGEDLSTSPQISKLYRLTMVVRMLHSKLR